MPKRGLIIANFGGPRNLEEVFPFLSSLLTDSDVIRTLLPSSWQSFLFRYIAKRRSYKVVKDYEWIGGGSPIFFDTEWVAQDLRKRLHLPTAAFHRYLPMTHDAFLEQIVLWDVEELIVFPLFPQFSYVTTGSIARWFQCHMPRACVEKLRWIASYPNHASYVGALCSIVQDLINRYKISNPMLIFSAHGLPEKYIQEGDPYQKECEASFAAVASYFSMYPSLLCYQSKFGRGKWLQPATDVVCAEPSRFFSKQHTVIFIPLSFSSDHIETLFEIEKLYVGSLQRQGISAFRCPALGRDPRWMQAIEQILQNQVLVANESLIR